MDSELTPNVPGSPMSVDGVAKASAPSVEHHKDPCLVREAQSTVENDEGLLRGRWAACGTR